MKHLLPCSVVAGILLTRVAVAQPVPGTPGGPERERQAQVEQAEVLVQQSDILLASLYLEGVLSSPCSTLQSPAVRRRGKVFRVLLQEKNESAGALCQSFGSARAPFYVSLPLDLDGLASGTYRVVVNELVLEFSIP